LPGSALRSYRHGTCHGGALTPAVYIRPSTTKMSKMIRIVPTAPLGPYPQSRLWGQAGTAPSRARTRMINSMVVNMVIR